MAPRLKAAPPLRLERLIARLLPPVVREEVAGDLWERYRTPGRYLTEAAAALPFLIMSQARRQTNGPLLMLQAFTIFASFGGFEPRFDAALRSLIATLPAIAALLLRAAYRSGDAWTGARAMGDLLWMLVAVLASQLIMLAIHPTLALPPGFLIGGLAFALVMLMVLRSGTDLVTGRTGPGAVEEDYGIFRQRVRMKNLIEAGLLAPLLAIAFWFATTARPVVAAIGFGWVALTLLLILLNMSRRPRVMPAALPMPGKLAFYRGQIARQRGLIGLSWWCYFVPLFGGLGVNLILRTVAAGQDGIATGGIACIALLAFILMRANRDRERQLGAKIAALDRLDRAAPA